MNRYKSFYFVLFFTWSSVYTLITLYLNEEIGLSLSTIGLVMSILPLISLVFQPIWGLVSDMKGNKRMVLQGLLIATALLTGVITLITQQFWVIALYYLYQIFLCGQGPLSDAMTIEYVNQASEGSYGFVRTWGSLGYAIGAFFVAWIANRYGLVWLFYIASFGYILSLLLTFRLDAFKLPRIDKTLKADLSALLKEKNYLFVLIYSFLLIGSFFGSDQYLGLFIRSTGVDLSKLGLLTFISVCVEVPLISQSKRLIKRFSATKLLIFMNVIAIFRMLVLSQSTSLWQFALAGVLRGLLVGIFVPLFVELIIEMTPRAVVTSAIAIYSAVSSGIANFIFTLISGFLADYVGYQGLFLTVGIFMVLPLGLAVQMHRKTHTA